VVIVKRKSIGIGVLLFVCQCMLMVASALISCRTGGVLLMTSLQSLLQYRSGRKVVLQSAPIKNNLFEKMLYFSHGSTDLSQTFRLCIWVLVQHILWIFG